MTLISRSFSAHLGYLFSELPLEKRFAAASRSGFKLVEHPEPFVISANKMRNLLDENDLRMVQIGTGSGGNGRKGLAALPGFESVFRENLLRALDFAEEVGCPLVHPMAGVPDREIDQTRCVDCWRANIAFAIEEVQNRPISILVEVINQITVPGYFLHRFDLYVEFISTLQEKPLLLLDSYHAALNEEDATLVVRSKGVEIGHVQIADSPGRHEPGSGGYDFVALEAALTEVGYDGAIGLEYVPQHSAENFDWIDRWPNC